MRDAFAYCAELVRRADRDRFLASLFAPAEHRGALHALYAFNIEIARVREVAREVLPGEIRLQWWREVIDGERSEEAQANPVAAALLDTIERYRLAPLFSTLIDAREFDLYDDSMRTMADLESYAAKTSSALITLTAQVLGADAQAAAQPGGIAYAITGLIRAFPQHAARRQLYVPVELLERFAVQPQAVFAHHLSSGLNEALGELRAMARRHLHAAHDLMTELPAAALPAFLPVALVRPMLDRLDHCDAFAPAELSLWRRQWLIWRAARNPARVAG
jgi:15-cis-phytoene synthase